MLIDRNKADHSISVRVSLETLHKLEAKVADANDANPSRPHSVSECVRKAIEVAFAVWEKDPVRLWNYCQPFLTEEIERILASGYADKKSCALLERIADKLAKQSEPNFG